MTILLAIQEAADILSLARPNSAISSVDETSRRLVTFAHISGDDICQLGDWSNLILSADVTAGVLPSDYLRLVTGGAVKRTAPTGYQLRGPLSSDQLRAIPMFGTTTVLGYAMKGGLIVYSRALAGETIEADYVSNGWLFNGATRVNRAVSDSNTLAFPFRLVTKGIVWRMKEQLSMSFESQKQEFIDDVNFALKQDRGVTT